MKTYVSNIKGKEYLYAYDKIIVARGKTIQKTKSLGSLRTPADVARKKNDFAELLINEEAGLRTEYWQKKIQDPKFVKYISLKKLEEPRARLYRGKRALGETGQAAMETAFMVDFIFNSNKIEGSKVPRESVEQIVKSGGRKNEEVGNTIKALQFAESGFKFNLKNILKLHSILLEHEPAKHGFRKVKVVVNNAEVLPWDKIKTGLRGLIKWYKNANRTWYAPELAFLFHYRFERIHPFLDGNGRVGRLLMNKILIEHHYHPMIIWNQRAKSFNNAFKKAMEGDKGHYFKFMIDEMTETYDIYIRKIEKAENLDMQLEYFLSPSK